MVLLSVITLVGVRVSSIISHQTLSFPLAAGRKQMSMALLRGILILTKPYRQRKEEHQLATYEEGREGFPC